MHYSAKTKKSDFGVDRKCALCDSALDGENVIYVGGNNFCLRCLVKCVLDCVVEDAKASPNFLEYSSEHALS